MKFHYRSSWKSLHANEFADCFENREPIVSLGRFYHLKRTHRPQYEKSPRLRPRKYNDYLMMSRSNLKQFFIGGFNHQVCALCHGFETKCESIPDKKSDLFRNTRELHRMHMDKAVNLKCHLKK